jgi:hypothetical protein
MSLFGTWNFNSWRIFCGRGDCREPITMRIWP